MLAFLKSLIAKNPAEIERNYQRLTTVIKSLSLSCNRCGRLATPILETENRYQCTHCLRQFSGKNHNIAWQISNQIEQYIVRHWKPKDYDLCVARIKQGEQ